MKYRPVVCLAIALSTFATPRPTAAATFTLVYDTVDSVELNLDSSQVTIVIVGIPAGGSTPLSRTFGFGPTSSAVSFPAASRCERLALATISRPGKYQFSIGVNNNGGPGACKLILVTP